MSIIAVERALVLLRYIVEHPEGLSIREVSREYGYSPATVQKLISALNNQNFITQDQSTERYHLGPEAVRLGLIALGRLEVRQAARPFLQALSDETEETVFLAIARRDHVIYIDKVVSGRIIRMDAPLGVDRPFNCTSVGKVLLSGMSSDKVAKLSAEGAFEHRTENSIVDPDVLLEELEQVRQRGWAFDGEEYAQGANCIGAPVYNHEGQIIAALTVSGPADRFEGNLDALADKVKSSAQAISKAMGYHSDG